MRIVSLLPSATEILFEIGLGDSVVGRSEECNWPPQAISLPVVSVARVRSSEVSGASIDAQVRAAMQADEQLYLIDEALLRELRPDVIVTQDLCRVCAVSSDEVCDVGARVVSLDPHTINEVADSVRHLANVLDVSSQGNAVADCMLQRIETVKSRVSAKDWPRVFFAEWLSPPFVSGHWIPEMVTAAGGIEVLGTPGVASRTTTWQEVRAAKPELVILGPCGFDEVRALSEAEVVRHEFDPAWKTVAVNADRYFARPAPSIADGVEQLAAIFHGGL